MMSFISLVEAEASKAVRSRHVPMDLEVKWLAEPENAELGIFRSRRRERLWQTERRYP